MSKIDTSSWKEFKISDLFDVVYGDIDIKKSDINNLGDYVITSGVENNGIAGKSDIKAKVISKNSLTVDMFGNVYYRDFNYKMVTHARVFALVPKHEFEVNEIGLFISSLLYYYKDIYSYDNMCSWNKIKDNIIKLPVKETEEIDFDYMESYMKNLEEVHVKNLEEVHVKNLYNYLKVADLENTELTDEEKDVLTRKVNYKEFKVKDLFEVENTFSYNMDSLVTGNDYDYITRTVLNNGICRTTNYISSKGINEKNVFSLELMNMTFFYREKEWYAGQFIRKVKFKYELNTLRALYLQSLLKPISKVLKSVLIRNVDDTFLNLSIYLPVKLNGEIDFDYMETYIKALEKLTIQKIYDDETLFINKTKEIIAE